MDKAYATKLLAGHNKQALLVGYSGSHHFGLTDELSDVDYLAYHLPQMVDVLTDKRDNGEYHKEEGVTVFYNSLLSLVRNVHKLSFNLLEVVSQPLYVEEGFEPILQDLRSLFLSEEGNRICLKNIYFIGLNHYNSIYKEVPNGSGALHIKDGVNYKALSKAVLYRDMLTTYKNTTTMLELYESNTLKQAIKNRYHDIRTNQTFNAYDELEDFYSKDNMKQYIQQEGKLDTSRFQETVADYLVTTYYKKLKH